MEVTITVSRPSTTLGAAVLGLLAVVLAACSPVNATAYSASELGGSGDGWRGIPLDVETPRELPDVTLEDTDGDPVELRETFLGRPTLLFFGYASCPDICPIHMAVLSSAMSQLRVSPEQVQVVFVTVDPERDTGEVIDGWLSDLGAPFVGLRGDVATIEAALDALDLPTPTVEGENPNGGELIGHPAQVIGFDADGVAQRVWPSGARRADWINDLPRILDDWTLDGGAEARGGMPSPVTEAGRIADRLDDGGTDR